MLKVRVIPVLLVQDGLLKKRIRFKETRTIANPLTVARVFEARCSDELIILDIGRTVDEDEIDRNLIRGIAEELYMPFAYGGGITSVPQMTEIIKNGAEKVVINTAAVENPLLITAGAEKFGSQCIIVSIDAFEKEDGFYEVYTQSGIKQTGLDPVAWAKEAERLGAGEILINAIQHEGTRRGYDLKLIRSVSDAVRIPVIAAGGVGKVEDFIAGVKEGHAAAVSAGSIFFYTAITPDMVKEAMKKAGIPVRQQGPG